MLPYECSEEDTPLKEACRWDVQRFAREFFPHLCALEFSEMHKDFFTQYREDKDRRGLKDATAAPRGHAKTTIKSFIKPLHDIVYQHEQYILIVSNPAMLAVDRVKQIRDELDWNTRLQAVYGPQATETWNQDDIVTVSGVRVRAASPQSQVRGLLWHGTRPTKIICDDIENSEGVLSQMQREKLVMRYNADFMKLGTTETNIEVIGTVLHPESLLAQLLTNPGYRHTRYQAILRFNDAYDLWGQWRSLFCDLTNFDHQEDARAFFESHQDEMLAGSAVLWEARESYYDLMVMRLVEGESAFWLEKQNDPRHDQRRVFQMDTAAYCQLFPEHLVAADGRQVRYAECLDVAAYLDPTPDKNQIVGTCYAACPVVLRDAHGYLYCVDTYLAQEMSTATQIEGIVEVLWRWQVPVLGIEANGFQSLLASDLREAIAQRAQEEGARWDVQIVPVMNMRNKILRIRTLEPLVANGWLQFATTLPGEAIRQLAEFLPVQGAGMIDFPDSLEGCIRVVKGML